MKFHLPVSLFRSVLACLVAECVLSPSTFAAAEYSGGSVEFSSSIEGFPSFFDYATLTFSNVRSRTHCYIITDFQPTKADYGDSTLFFFNGAYYGDARLGGGVLRNSSYGYSIRNNGRVSFENNELSLSWFNPSASSSVSMGRSRIPIPAEFSHGGIWGATSVDLKGGAVFNSGRLHIEDNEEVRFENNRVSSVGGTMGGAIYNGTSGASSSLCNNGALLFFRNAAEQGGALYNESDGHVLISGNEQVTFSGNVAESRGGAVYNLGTFSMVGNGDVLFENNSSCGYGLYSTGVLNLSSAAGKSITFRDSVYASGVVNLNRDGQGDIVFSCNSDAHASPALLDTHIHIGVGAYVSHLDTHAELFSGRLVVEEESVLRGRGITAKEGGNAVISLKNAILDESGYSVSLTSGSTLDIAGASSLSASVLDLQDGATLSIGAGSMLSLNATLQTGKLTLALSDKMYAGQQLIVLDDESQYDTTRWTEADIRVTGVGFHELSWQHGVLIYQYDRGGWCCTTPQNGPLNLSGLESVRFENVRGTAIKNEEISFLTDNGSVTFSKNARGGIYNYYGTFTISGNGKVLFEDHKFGGYGCAVYNEIGDISLSDNEELIFKDNGGGGLVGALAVHLGSVLMDRNTSVLFSDNDSGAVSCHSYGSIGLSENGTVSFSRNSATIGGAVNNESAGMITIADNGEVFFLRNQASVGGALANSGLMFLTGNADLTFAGNAADECGSVGQAHLGGAVYNTWVFSLCGNGNVLFEKNAEFNNQPGEYGYGGESPGNRLRSIYSEGTLNLSAGEGGRITFRDSVYAGGTVNLNLDGTGDIIITGATTESDFSEMFGRNGTSAEILNSRTSELAANATLYGGRLTVEEGAILKGQGITVADGAKATIRLNNGTLDEGGAALSVSSGSGLEFEGGNVLSASSVNMADNSFLRFVMGGGSGTLLNAQLLTGQLNVQLDGDLFNVHQLLTLSDASQYDTASWTRDSVSVSGASFDSLSWDAGVLTYTPHVITPGEDCSVDDMLPDDGNAIINGNGHTLTVKTEVQLVQMALKDGIVKLEGENNNIVSVTLTEGGELVLSAGAGLTTGDIISMVASGKGELVISGDITLDNKGMKGKDGELATLSHADVQVLGDAGISNVRVEDSTIDLAEGCTVNFSQVVLAATARLTDEPAKAHLDEVTAELMMGVNTAKVADGVLPVGGVLVQNGNTAQTLSPEAEATVVQLKATTFDSLTLTGSSLVLELRGLETELYNGADYIALSFTSGKAYATFEEGLAVLLSTDGEHYAQGLYLQGADHTTLYFAAREAGMAPEPATATLSLLALAALAARRRRK